MPKHKIKKNSAKCVPKCASKSTKSCKKSHKSLDSKKALLDSAKKDCQSDFVDFAESPCIWLPRVGIDIVKISRIERILSRYKEAFLKRFLRKCEIELLQSKGFAPASVAGFFASKEACSKALGVGISKNLGFKDMILSYTSANAPQITLSKRASKHFSKHFKKNRLSSKVADKVASTSPNSSAQPAPKFTLSISHDGGFAIAVVLCLR